MAPALTDLTRTAAGAATEAAGAAAGAAGAVADKAAGLVSPALARIFGGVARVRTGRGLHPRGTVLGATLHVTGPDRPTGADWIDRPREERVVVRLSRAAGVPAPWPDVLGLALRTTGPDGRPADLLLSSTGRRPVLRHVLLPGTDPLRMTYSSLVRFAAPTGSLLLGALPDGTGARRLHLAVARPGGAWKRFATLELDDAPHDDSHDDSHDDPDRPAGGGRDAHLHFEPVAHTPPGLRMPAPLARLRGPSYRASREAYHPGGADPDGSAVSDRDR